MCNVPRNKGDQDSSRQRGRCLHSRGTTYPYSGCHGSTRYASARGGSPRWRYRNGQASLGRYAQLSTKGERVRGCNPIVSRAATFRLRIRLGERESGRECGCNSDVAVAAPHYEYDAHVGPIPMLRWQRHMGRGPRHGQVNKVYKVGGTSSRKTTVAKEATGSSSNGGLGVCWKYEVGSSQR